MRLRAASGSDPLLEGYILIQSLKESLRACYGGTMDLRIQKLQGHKINHPRRLILTRCMAI